METLTYQTDTKAKKEHSCDFCGEKIRVGETYSKSTHKHEGSVYDWKTHKHCSDLATQMKMYDECEEGVTQDDFIEYVSSKHFDLLVGLFPEKEIQKYSDVIQQIRYVSFKQKLSYVIRHYAKLNKEQDVQE